MHFNKRLLVFPTSRSIRSYISRQKDINTLLPSILTIDELFKKSVILENKKYIDEEQRFLFLKESIKNIDISKLGISNDFTKFLKQNDYIYRFFLELSSEKIEISEIKNVDTYEYYYEHLKILENIRKKYISILDENNSVDRINIENHYKINKNFLSKFDCVEIKFEGYFTKVEFDIVNEISKYTNVIINFFSNEYNQKSLDIFKEITDVKLELDYEYKIDITNKKIIDKNPIVDCLEKYDVKAFSSRINQIAFIKESIVNSVNKGVEPSSIALVLPDESFATSLALFDSEGYFNYAMGVSIKDYKLYQVAYAISSYLNEDEVKNTSNIEYLKLDKLYIDNNIKPIWKKICSEDTFAYIYEYLKESEENEEILQKLEEVFYKLNILLFSSKNNILLKDVYKILLQRISKITLDDVNSGKITVLGLLETRAVTFDTVIICDFNENFIPKRSIKDKFLSSKIKNLVNLPTQEDRESLQKYYYKRLISSSREVYISYISSDTNQISRFANELFNMNTEAIISDNNYKHILYSKQNINHFKEEIIDKVDLSKLSWSATSLKIYLDCKRKFYLQYIGKIHEHTISLKPKGYELGSIIHSILENFYSFDKNDYSFKDIEELFLRYRSSNPFLALDLEIWKKKLYDFYEYDSLRLEDRKIIALEKQFAVTFDEIQIKGVIDRVDLFNETYEVIDYKTSSSLKVDSLKNYEKSNDFQLEFYYLAMSEIYKTDKIHAYYYDLNNTLLIEELALDKKLELLVEKFKEIKEISKKEISFTKCEEKSNCIYCSYKTICNR